MKNIIYAVMIVMLTGCGPEQTPRAMISEQALAKIKSEAHALMLAQASDSVVWDDAAIFTNMILEVWGEGNNLKCDILLTDRPLENHGFRFQRFHYMPGSEEIILEKGLGTMVE